MGDILSDWGSKDEAAKKEEEKEEESSGEDFFIDSKKHKNKKQESESLKFENNADTGGEDKEKYGKEVAVPWKRRKCYTRRKRSDDLEMRKQRKALNESGKNTPMRESAEGKAGQIPMMATQGTDSADKMATQDDQSGLDHTGASSEKTGVDYSHSANDLQKWEDTQHSNEKVDIGMQETPKSPEELEQVVK
ncbi:unnamed protein product [Nippostrongylus brasiliensis]|uniref:HABP4_PAI-RBP1 domain-containing protein n=1 Tax=Nippostrongylus brasiliensis TaxID=27835 RepID=A0A0N4YN44_NIPBR|nr:unnamed protein product [Nippostrongylus brasiliensis]